jgi:hypothetical protein
VYIYLYYFIFYVYFHEYVGTNWSIVLVDREGEINKKMKNDKKKSGSTQGFSQGTYVYVFMYIYI